MGSEFELTEIDFVERPPFPGATLVGTAVKLLEQYPRATVRISCFNRAEVEELQSLVPEAYRDRLVWTWLTPVGRA